MGKTLKNLLSEKRTTVLDKWFGAVLETYPPDTSKFLREQKDRFANPVGSTIYNGMQGLLEILLTGKEAEKISLLLDDIVRIRAIQDFTASQAVAFVFILKRVIRDEAEKNPELNSDRDISKELLALESEIDEMALSAFDIFMKCREKLYEIKSNEVKNMTFRLLQKANLMTEIKEQGQIADGSSN